MASDQRDELTMDRAAQRLAQVAFAAGFLRSEWEELSDAERLEVVEDIQGELADLATMALGYRYLARANGVYLPDDGESEES